MMDSLKTAEFMATESAGAPQNASLQKAIRWVLGC